MGLDVGGIIGDLSFGRLERCRTGTLYRICHYRSSSGFYGFSNDVCYYYGSSDYRRGGRKNEIQLYPGFCRSLVYPGLLPGSSLGMEQSMAGYIKLGALDFAGGTVVHINAGVSALSLAMLLGPRKDYQNGVTMGSHNVPFVVIGAGLLWFGWFGFNAGSALTSGGLAASAFVATNTAAAAAALTWMFLSWFYHRPTVSGIATGAVAGLVAVTPAAGFVNPIMGIPIGIGVSVICFFMMRLRNKTKSR